VNETTKGVDRLLHLATAAERANDVDSARRRYARCLELDDGSDSLAHYPCRPSVRCAAWFLHATFLRDQKDLRGALAIALPAARRWPDFPDLLLLIGECHPEMGELDPAEDAYRRCISMDGPRFTESRVLALSFLAP
jgi:tetratricopeptide (TPR) repeat protein